MKAVDDAQPTRLSLLRAAREELIEQGHAAVSLRAVARRAGVSHAAPAHFFGDRAGMLTAVATDGFTALAQALHGATESAASGETRLAALGRAYVEFGLANEALLDLMFRRSELLPDDPELIRAQRSALIPLTTAVTDVANADPTEWSLLSWAVAHGVVTLAREGVLTRIAGWDPGSAGILAKDLVRLYSEGVPAASSEAKK
jgi:AcrR family transcriptional regulator